MMFAVLDSWTYCVHDIDIYTDKIKNMDTSEIQQNNIVIIIC